MIETNQKAKELELNTNFKEVGDFYNGQIARFWELFQKRSMHVGYWDEKNMDELPAEASMRLTDMLIEKVPINQNGTFVDLGCGFGLPAIALARKKKCKVYGVTASSYQKDEAKKMAQQQNVSKLVKFFVDDARNTRFTNQKFDAGWFFESIFHMGHEEALFEARRILKPGAMLLIADFIALPSLNEEDKKNLFEAYHARSLKTFDEYPSLLEQNGFKVTEISDVTEQTIKIMKNKYIEALNVYKDDIIKIVGSIQFFEQMKHLWISATEIMEKNFGYAIISCRKSDSAKYV